MLRSRFLHRFHRKRKHDAELWRIACVADLLVLVVRMAILGSSFLQQIMSPSKGIMFLVNSIANYGEIRIQRAETNRLTYLSHNYTHKLVLIE